MRTFRLHVLVVALLMAACSREHPAPATPATAAPAVTPAAAPAPPAPVAAPAEAVFSQEELDQMVAPIALYPDSLLTQVLMAVTYPGNVADAVAWSKAHPEAKGDDAVKQVADQPWDPSVQSLVAFPQVLATLGQDPAWVQRLGDAFLAQPDEVMDAVQRLRHSAQAVGNLQSTPQQTVTTSPAPAAAPEAAPADAGAAPAAPQGDTIIQIAPTDPQVVYVPSYNPTTVYGTWPYPSYPPTYYPPPPGYYAGEALLTGLAFGTGVAVADALWGDWDWHGNDVDINVNRYNNINVNRHIDVNNNVWRHNSNFRGNVPYRDGRSREQFDRNRVPGAENRQAFRGNDAAHDASRERARQQMQKRGLNPATDNRQARADARTAGRDLGKRPGADVRRPDGQAGTQDARARARNVADARTQHPQAGQRAGAGQHAKAGGKAGAAGPRTTHANSQARTQARSQHAQQRPQPRAQQPRAQSRPQARSASHNNAFAGASHPSQARANVNRGQASHAKAQRPASARSGGHPVQRAPQQHAAAGGARRRR